MAGTFFQNAKNVKVTGGEFNIVHGNYTVFDQSRHTTNLDSYNTLNNNLLNAHNDNSKHYRGKNARSRERPDDLPPSTSHAPENPPQAMPPIMPHAMMQPQPSLPGGRTTNIGAFNITNTKLQNVNNDNSMHDYRGGQPPMASRRAGGRGTSSRTSNAQDEYDGDQDPMSVIPSKSRHPTSRTGKTQFQSPQSSVAPFSKGFPQHQTHAAVQSGQVQSMSPSMRQLFDTLMQRVKRETGPQPGDEEYSDEEQEGSGSDDRHDASAAHARDTLDAGMSALSLNDAQRPPFSHVKSDPQLPLPTNTSGMYPSPNAYADPMIAQNAAPYPARVVPIHSYTTPYTPAHMTDPMMLDIVNGQATQSTQTIPAGTVGPNFQAPTSSSSLPFGSGQAVSSGPIVRTIHGNLTKYDNTINTTNMNSGNVENNLIQDSFNDNSVNTNISQDRARKARKQGK
ncbi:hypothetical protein B0H34DRAFT_680413 [Crassisporium funariophilum]|nr:hypothetical protein B0H34DRAFT_680413 [Crassisporium funariophilum]